MYKEQSYFNLNLNYLREINKRGMCIIIKLFSKGKKN